MTFPFVPEAALTRLGGKRTETGWVREGDPLAGRMVPAKTPHAGPLVVFVDEATHSAAVELTVGLLAHRAGVRVVGRETQGGCDRHTGEIPVLFELPGTSVKMLASLLEIELVSAPGCTPGRGVVPDVYVEPTLEGYLAGRDPFLDAL